MTEAPLSSAGKYSPMVADLVEPLRTAEGAMKDR